MTTAIRRRRGTTVQHSTFTGLEGEVTVDTTKKTLVVHDGSTAGGMPLLPKTMSDGTANGVAYLNGSKVLTTGSALTFDGSILNLNSGSNARFYRGDNARYGFVFADNNGLNIGATSTSGEELRYSATGSHIFFAGASPSEQMRLTSTGLGIGTSSPSVKLDVVGAGVFKLDGSGSTTPLILRNNNTASTQLVKLGFDSNGAIKASINAAVYGNDYMTFNVGSDTERARIDSSGNLLVGTTSGSARLNLTKDSGDLIVVTTSGGGTGYVYVSGTTTGNAGYFQTSSGLAGSIQCSGTSTSYVTSSDYRLKQDIAPMTDALAKVAALKPVTYKWKADGSDGEGFIAHELAEVVPQCVTGQKDAVDAEGNPVYQGIDTSFLVATLAAAIKELKAEFDAYKATHP
jgi:hypothetical protein